jgi:hypothetical protein
MARLTDNPNFDQLESANPGVKKRGPIKIPTMTPTQVPSSDAHTRFVPPNNLIAERIAALNGGLPTARSPRPS